jgi:hypothetical protein
MSPRRQEWVVSATVAGALAVFWIVLVAREPPPESPGKYVMVAALWAVVSAPWVIAARLLWRAWWARVPAPGAYIDGPAWLLAAAVRALPGERRDWGAAMIAELAQVQGAGARWWFAAGCARVALFPPRAPRRRLGQAGPLATAAGLTGVAGCIALLAHLLVNHPSAAAAMDLGTAMVFAAVMAGGLWLTLSPPRALTGSPLARGLAVGAALILAAGLVPASRLSLGNALLIEMGAGPYLMFAPVLINMLASAAAARLGRSFGAGVEAAVWTTVIGTLALFVVSVPEALHWHRTAARLFFDGERYNPVGRNVGAFVACLVMLPLWSLPFGVIGARLGAARSRLR